MAQHAFWIILDGQTPTSFRSRQREDLVPTLNQLKRTQPGVVLMWFERGRMWASPTEAREALIVRRKAPARRPREWRPGGDHVDPRAKYDISRDQKRARFKARAQRDRREAPGPGDGPPPPPRTTESGPSRPPERAIEPRPNRPPERTPGSRPTRPPYRPPQRNRPFGDRPFNARAPRPGGRPPAPERERSPRSPAPEARSREAETKPKGFGDRPWRPKKPWQPGKPWRPGKPKGGKG